MLSKLLMILEKYDKVISVMLWIMAAVFFINAAICANRGIGYVIANIIIGVCLLLVSGPINPKGKESDNDSSNDNKSEG